MPPALRNMIHMSIIEYKTTKTNRRTDSTSKMNILKTEASLTRLANIIKTTHSLSFVLVFQYKWQIKKKISVKWYVLKFGKLFFLIAF